MVDNLDREETEVKKLLKRTTGLATAAAIAAIGLSTTAFAGPDDNKLLIEGVPIPTEVKAPEGSPFDTLYSGWRFRTSETQALQEDNFDNPAFAAVETGGELWGAVDGTAGKSCASCHNDGDHRDHEGRTCRIPEMERETR